MPRRHLDTLISIDKNEMPLLESDLQNASTLYALQACAKRLHVICEFLVRTQIHAIYAMYGESIEVEAPPPPPPAPSPQTARAYQAPRHLGSHRQQPAAPQSTTMEVTITPNGTKINAPGLPPASFVPGEPAHLDFGSPGPLSFNAVPLQTGVPVGGTREAPAEVFLPRGGDGGQAFVAQPPAQDITGR